MLRTTASWLTRSVFTEAAPQTRPNLIGFLILAKPGYIKQSARVTKNHTAPRGADSPAWRNLLALMWFGVWSAIGALYALALVGAMTIGIFVLPVAVLSTVLIRRRRAAMVGLPGLISGASLPLMYIAYLYRDGPGTVCVVRRGGVECTDEWSPWPWLAIAIAMLVAGGVVFVHRSRAMLRPDQAP